MANKSRGMRRRWSGPIGSPTQGVGEEDWVQRETEKDVALWGVKRKVDSHTVLQPRRSISTSSPPWEPQISSDWSLLILTDSNEWLTIQIFTWARKQIQSCSFKCAKRLHVLVLVVQRLGVTVAGVYRQLYWHCSEPLEHKAQVNRAAWARARETVHIYGDTRDGTRAQAVRTSPKNTTIRRTKSPEIQ
jgi:hypothetical protein